MQADLTTNTHAKRRRSIDYIWRAFQILGNTPPHFAPLSIETPSSKRGKAEAPIPHDMILRAVCMSNAPYG